MKKVHPADIAALRSIATAIAFKVHYRRNPMDPTEDQIFPCDPAKPWVALRDARVALAALTATVGGGRRPILYALLPNDRSEFVPAEYIMARRPRVTNDTIRELYSKACHGAGAEVRNAARQQLEVIAEQSNQRLGQFFDEHNLNLANYFASRPIS